MAPRLKGLVASVVLSLLFIAWSLCLVTITRSHTTTQSVSAQPPSMGQTGPGRSNTQNTNAFDWNGIVSKDFQVYSENLRALGCPEETIRNIIVGEICKVYAPRLREARASAERRNYWERPRPFSPIAFSPYSTLLKERNDLINKVLGVDLSIE